MNLSHGRLAPVPGSSGLVVRTAGAVLFVAGREPGDLVRRLTATVRGHGEPAPARALARELASLVAADDDGALPGFALVAASAGGTYVKVYGSVEVQLSGPGGSEVLTGVGSFTGIDREIAGTFTTIAAHPAGQGAAEADEDLDVHGGTTLGDGFVLVATDGGTEVSTPPVSPGPSTADLPPTQPLTSEPEPAVEPPPVAEPVEAPAPAAEAPPMAEPPAAEAPAAEVAPEPAAPSEAADVAAMQVVSTPSSPPPAGEEDVVAPTSDEPPAAAAPPAAEPVDAPTQAWTPGTADFEADDLAAGQAAAAGAPVDEPAWGSAEPDVAAAPAPSLDKAPSDDAPLIDVPSAPEPSDAPSWYVPPVADEPAAPPEAETVARPPTPEPERVEPTAWEDLPVAEDPPPAHEGATMAIPPMPEPEAPAPAEPPAAEPVEPASFTSQLLGALDDEEVDEREALPVELDPAEVRQADHGMTEEVLVHGVICSRGHFNDPRSRFCSSCGISMVQNTQTLTQGPRPPLGVMVFEDGATFSLSSDYVVGRQPDVHDLVQQGLALPLPVDDPERSISRAHAELRLVEWDVHLVNLSGTNGSFVWDENGQTWIPIPEGQSVVLTPGMRVALGRRSAVFESSLVR